MQDNNYMNFSVDIHKSNKNDLLLSLNDTFFAICLFLILVFLAIAIHKIATQT